MLQKITDFRSWGLPEDLELPRLASTQGLDGTGGSWLAHTVHKEHPLGQGLVEKHVLYPEVQWKEETHFILSWELAHVSSSRGDHMMGPQGASPGLFPRIGV